MRTVVVELRRAGDPGWAQARDRHLSRHYHCAACSFSGDVVVHLIDPAFGYKASNLISLCVGPEECHRRLGHGGSWGWHNPKIAEHAAAYQNARTRRNIIGLKLALEDAQRARVPGRCGC